MKITKELRERVKIIEGRLGLFVLDITKQGKHPKLHVSNGTITRKITVPLTSSDRKSLQAMESFIKREFALTA